MTISQCSRDTPSSSMRTWAFCPRPMTVRSRVSLYISPIALPASTIRQAPSRFEEVLTEPGGLSSTRVTSSQVTLGTSWMLSP